MGLNGELTADTLADVFQILALGGREGTLRVYDARRARVLRIAHSGVQILSTDTENARRIGDLLVRRGCLTSDQLREALRRQQATPALLGEIFVQLGWVRQDQVDEIVRLQIEEEIYDLFLWRDARFEFRDEPGERLAANGGRLRQLEMDITRVLMEAMRRRDEWPRIGEGIRGGDALFRWVDAEAEGRARASASLPLRWLAEAVDGTHTVRDLVESSPLGRFRVWRTIAEWSAQGWLVEVPADEAVNAARGAEDRGDPETAARMWDAAVRQAGPLARPEWIEAIAQHTTAADPAAALALWEKAADRWRAAGRTRELAAALDGILRIDAARPGVRRERLDLAMDSGDRLATLEHGRALIDQALSKSNERAALHAATRMSRAHPEDLEIRLFLVHLLSALDRPDESRAEHNRILKELTPTPEELAAVERGSRAVAGSRTTILLADDDRPSRYAMRVWLHEAGYRVIECKSGEEAVRRAHDDLPNLAMLDVMMPGVDGLEACRRLKEDSNTRSIPVILVSARSRARDVVAAADVGAEGYIVKPCPPDVLLRRVASVLEVGDPPVGVPPDESGAVATVAKGPLDPDVLSRLRGVGSGSLVRRLAGMFLNSAPERIRAANSSNLRDVERAAHSLVSSAGNLGAKRVQEAAEKLERAARDRAGELVRSLRRELECAYEEARPDVERLAAGGRSDA